MKDDVILNVARCKFCATANIIDGDNLDRLVFDCSACGGSVVNPIRKELEKKRIVRRSIIVLMTVFILGLILG